MINNYFYRKVWYKGSKELKSNLTIGLLEKNHFIKNNYDCEIFVDQSFMRWLYKWIWTWIGIKLTLKGFHLCNLYDLFTINHIKATLNYLDFIYSHTGQKKFYTISRIRVSQLAKILTLFADWWRSLNWEKG